MTKNYSTKCVTDWKLRLVYFHMSEEDAFFSNFLTHKPDMDFFAKKWRDRVAQNHPFFFKCMVSLTTNVFAHVY